ncbi:hypothetical protein [Cognatilysobacter bugurensis]|uniref:Uncharacterized protein n=1 Tax=Cognatilysobacter bugurensis TaxID=543356 RepID=A0A918SZV2_9GAMM|nr:hypothetical protein [Lysobacter bugurensis]GHA80371.1 hypothetical protein GCM10007067_17650 [Lysobacter bugurensis]
MNLLITLFSTHLPRPQNRSAVAPLVARPAQRERGLGVGYGSSSGYAPSARYAPYRAAPRLRFG